MVNPIKQHCTLLVSSMHKKKSTPCCILWLCLLAISTLPKTVMSQNMVGAFVMSSVGSIQNASNSSMALTFSSNNACLNIQNGTAVLTGERATGLFALNCNVVSKFNTLGIMLFPNPVNIISKIKFNNKPTTNEIFIITVLSSDGVKLFNDRATGEQLFQGKQVDFSSLSTGTFVIQVESTNYLDAIKFIKAK